MDEEREGAGLRYMNEGHKGTGLSYLNERHESACFHPTQQRMQHLQYGCELYRGQLVTDDRPRFATCL